MVRIHELFVPVFQHAVLHYVRYNILFTAPLYNALCCTIVKVAYTVWCTMIDSSKCGSLCHVIAQHTQYAAPIHITMYTLQSSICHCNTMYHYTLHHYSLRYVCSTVYAVYCIMVLHSIVHCTKIHYNIHNMLHYCKLQYSLLHHDILQYTEPTEQLYPSAYNITAHVVWPSQTS